MSNIILPPNWNIPARQITPESVFHNRREFLKLMGFATTSLAAVLYAPPVFARGALSKIENLFETAKLDTKFEPVKNLKRNPEYTVRRLMTDEMTALKYNNFYEFSMEKDKVWKAIRRFKPRPWQVTVSGLVEKPAVYDIDELIRLFTVEERVYRLRCVEAWAMVVPWNGFPMKALIDKVQPKPSARYVKFTSFLDPEVAPIQKLPMQRLPWPYTEALTMDEAMNELTFLSTGIYGHVLPPQNGAPIRLVVPWKYGFKSIKSIVNIEFTDKRPATFWNTLIPHEYGFEANVDPDVPHPRWSQRREKMIGTGEVYSTQKFNGYGDYVAQLYA